MITYERLYPYSSDYLRDLLYRKKLGGTRILAITYEMQDWLSEFVRKDGINYYQWSKPKTTVYDSPDTSNREFSDLIYFRYEADLLVFRLRWGIQD